MLKNQKGVTNILTKIKAPWFTCIEPPTPHASHEAEGEGQGETLTPGQEPREARHHRQGDRYQQQLVEPVIQDAWNNQHNLLMYNGMAGMFSQVF